MKESTHIAMAVDAVGKGDPQYDTSVKELLADKQILSRILKYTLREFEAMEPDEIAARIEDEPKIGTVPVAPGLTNFGKVKGGNTESCIPGEGVIFFDIFTDAACDLPPSAVVIDLEAQKDARPSKLGYHVENRAQFYLARMISSEKQDAFYGSGYDSVRPAKSIWICMNSGEPSITRYTMKPEMLYGDAESGDSYEPKSLMEYVIVKILGDGSGEESKNELISLLEDLLCIDSPAEKKRKLSTRHGIKMEAVTEGRIDKMCDLSIMVEERGINIGMERGREQGIDIGKEMANRSTAVALHKKGVPDDEIADFVSTDIGKVKEWIYQ